MQFFIIAFSFLIFTDTVYSQKVVSNLKFEQGQVFEIEMKTNTIISQQAMGQAIDFKVDADANHSYTVNNTTGANSTLRHQVK